MMMESRQIDVREEPIGDTVVNGLLYGIVGGLVIALYLLVLGLFGGPSAQEILIAISPVAGVTPLTGFVAHLAVASIYGILWGVLYAWLGSRLPMPAWLFGILYGLLLTAIVAVVRPPSNVLPSVGIWYIGSAHLLYGLTLGLLQGRK